MSILSHWVGRHWPTYDPVNEKDDDNLTRLQRLLALYDIATVAVFPKRWENSLKWDGMGYYSPGRLITRCGYMVYGNGLVMRIGDYYEK